jgi:hypothetical protein
LPTPGGAATAGECNLHHNASHFANVGPPPKKPPPPTFFTSFHFRPRFNPLPQVLRVRRQSLRVSRVVVRRAGGREPLQRLGHRVLASQEASAQQRGGGGGGGACRPGGRGGRRRAGGSLRGRCPYPPSVVGLYKLNSVEPWLERHLAGFNHDTHEAKTRFQSLLCFQIQLVHIHCGVTTARRSRESGGPLTPQT